MGLRLAVGSCGNPHLLSLSEHPASPSTSGPAVRDVFTADVLRIGSLGVPPRTMPAPVLTWLPPLWVLGAPLGGPDPGPAASCVLSPEDRASPPDLLPHPLKAPAGAGAQGAAASQAQETPRPTQDHPAGSLRGHSQGGGGRQTQVLAVSSRALHAAPHKGGLQGPPGRPDPGAGPALQPLTHSPGDLGECHTLTAGPGCQTGSTLRDPRPAERPGLQREGKGR